MIAAAVAAAPIVFDPIQQLLDDVQGDTAACFEDEALDTLATLRATDPAKYQRVRTKLHASRVNVRELDKLTGVEQSARRPGHDFELLRLIALEAELFRTPGGDTYADVIVDGHRETWAVSSQGFVLWLTREFFNRTEQAPGSEHLKSIIQTLQAKALFGERVRDVHLRTAEKDGKIYVDLGDAAWRTVEIDQNGWRILADPPVRFRRANGMLPLPEPQPGGSLVTLREFINVQDDADFIVAASWLVSAVRPGGPFPVLVVAGEQGAAKSTFSSCLRALVDPSQVPLKTFPRDEHNLFITAANSHVVAFDNVSAISPWLSDALCRVATGGGFATRKLYTDQQEVMFSVVKPLILNGIGEIVTRPDLGDRSIFLELAPISDAQRRPARDLETEFEQARPALLGALYDAVSLGLRRVGSISLDGSPRMADYAKWSVACELAFCEEGGFIAAFNANREALVESVIESDPVACALLVFADKRGKWAGTATQLLEELGRHCPEAASKDWPRTAKQLSEQMRRAKTFLRKKGIDIEYRKEGRSRTRIVDIVKNAPGTEED